VDRYIQLTNIEAAFRSLKSDLGLRPIHHRLERRVEAHIFVAFLAYCLQVTLKNSLRNQAPGLTPQAVMEKLATIQMIDVWIPTTDRRWLVMPRYTSHHRRCRSCSTSYASSCPNNLPRALKPRLQLPLSPHSPLRSNSQTNFNPRFCGEDPGLPFTHSIAFIRPNVLQVRKSG